MYNACMFNVENRSLDKIEISFTALYRPVTLPGLNCEYRQNVHTEV